MPVISSNKLLIAAVFLFIFAFNSILAEEFIAFQGETNGNSINVRSDSTVSAESICKVDKGERVEVISELYDWYKIRLPENASVFIKHDLATPIDGQTARVEKNNVNIRLKANESSPIIGSVQKNEIVNVIKDKGEWYEIKPTNNSFGWVHKKFVHKIDTNKTEGTKIEKNQQADLLVTTIEGLIKPYGKFIKRIATHTLTTEDKKIFLLKGNKENLNLLNNQRVRIIGKLIQHVKEKYPLIEIEKIEALE